MSKDEALMMALEALSDIVALANLAEHNGRPLHLVRAEPVMRAAESAVEAIRAALAEPEPEPVAWMVYGVDGRSVRVTDNPPDIGNGERALPLYTGTVAQDKPSEAQMLGGDLWGGGRF